MRDQGSLNADYAKLNIMSSTDATEASSASRPDERGGNSTRRLRMLAIGDVYPWPARDGYRLRFSAILTALSEIGDVDVFVGGYEGDEVGTPPSNIVRRESVVTVPALSPSVMLALRTIVSTVPSRILWRRWDEARFALHNFARGPYDVVWYSHADTYVAFRDPALGPAVVDLDNLENNVLRATYSLSLITSTPLFGKVRLPRPNLAMLAKWLRNRRDRPIWARLQRTIAHEAVATVVCSEADRKRLEASSVVVIPNSYPDPGPRMNAVPDSPILVMVGLFSYQPNLDGATWFVNEVLPELRRMVPDVRVRFVGRHDERLLSAESAPGVEIVGEVADLGPELRSARGAVIPLLNGSGTRIKVLEAFAYGIPLVTTRIGCEGFDLVDNVHALIRNEPLDFARGCVQVLTDNVQCVNLSNSGRSFYVDGYSSTVIGERIRQLALDVARLSAAP